MSDPPLGKPSKKGHVDRALLERNRTQKTVWALTALCWHLGEQNRLLRPTFRPLCHLEMMALQPGRSHLRLVVGSEPVMSLPPNVDAINIF